MKIKKIPSTASGFTIVELLIAIVIIGILAAITIVSYTGVTKKATEAGLTSDLSGAQKQLEMFKVENGKYPETTRCDIPDSNINKCVKPSSGNNYTYTAIPKTNPTQYTLENTKGNTNYIVGTNTPIKTIDLTEPNTCPSGFIPVPGSLTYATSGFCVMKYEAKRVGATNVPISTAAGLPWSSVSQNNAIAYSKNTANCTGCHVLTESEWMTLAQNILSVAGNWSDNIAGSGYAYMGHGDKSPNSAIEASVDDANGYINTLNSSGEVALINGLAGDSQKRTLKLTNNQTIWDLAGNVREWTSGQSTSVKTIGLSDDGEPYVYEWTDIPIPGALSTDPSPSGTGISGSKNWTSANGIGLFSRITIGGTNLRGYIHGGFYGSTKSTGVLELVIGYTPSQSFSDMGFRVAAPAQ